MLQIQMKLTLSVETLAENDEAANSTISPSFPVSTEEVAQDPFSVENTVDSSPIHQYSIPAAQTPWQHHLAASHHTGNHVCDEICRDDHFNHLLELRRQREAELSRLEENHPFGFKHFGKC